MKAILLITLIIFFNSSIFSQWGSYESSLGASAGLSLPTGKFSNDAGTGYGIKAKYIWMFNGNFGWISEAGYLTWLEKNSISQNSFLLNTGLKINFMPIEVGPYFFTTLGIHFLSYEANYSFFGESFSFSDSNQEFNISGGLGYEYEIQANIYLDSSISYCYLTDSESSYIGINIGVNFGLF